MNYEEAVGYILKIPRFTVKNSLEHTRALWELLGSPGKEIPAVHVAGTNGKGSVCAFLSSVLEKAGEKTGMFTSPHLVRINERFRIHGEPVSDERFLASFEPVYELTRRLEGNYSHPTFFEFLFLMAMVLFDREQVDCLILETGLGGRLDSTNILKRPAATAITSVGLDHMQYLGSTVEEIAAEKAGILKEGVPVVYDAKKPQVRRVIEERAESLSCPLLPVYPEDVKISKKRKKTIDFSYQSRYDKYISLSMPQCALFQVENAMLAIRLAEYLLDEKRMYPDAAALGIRDMRWEGRMEEIGDGVYLDGAHNQDGMAAFVSTAAELSEGRKKVLLFSAVNDKDYEAMVRQLSEAAFDVVILTTIDNQRGVPAGKMREVFRRFTDCEPLVVNPVMSAYRRGVREKGKDGILFIAGSLYLAGEVKAGIGGSYDKF